jgi:hypothetical protein
MQLTPKFLHLTLVLATAFYVGCGQDGSTTEQLAGGVDESNPDRRPQTNTPTLNCSHQVYDNAGARNVLATLENPDFSDIKVMLEEAFADASAPRARIFLTRNVDDGHIVAMSRMPDGKLEISVNMKINGQWFEASESDIDSLAAATKVFKAFYDTDANIQTMIKWDEVVE